jgi:hypothetical protein
MMKLAIAILTLLSCLVCSVDRAHAQTSMKNGPCLTFMVGAGPNEPPPDENAIGIGNSCKYPVASYSCYFIQGNTGCTLVATVVNGMSSATVTQEPFFDETITLFGYECPAGSTNVAGMNFVATATSSPPACQTVTSSAIAAAALPNAFAAEVNSAATVFATIADSSGGTNCRIALPQPAASGFSLGFQQTNPSTNAPIGSPNTPVTIGSSGSASFELTFNSSAVLQQRAVPLIYSCDGAVAPLSVPGVSSVDVNFTSGPTANIVAEAETTSNNGILTVPAGSSGAFAVATDNAGNTSATVSVVTDTGNATLPVTITICQTNSSTGACLATPASTLSVSIPTGATPTFSVFVKASGSIASAPATNRIFLRFEVNGAEVGATSVAIQS